MKASLLRIGLVCLVAAGCRGKSGQYLNENDKLRSENLSLRHKVEKLEKDLVLRLAQVQTLENQLDASVAIEGVDASQVPQLVAVTFGRFTGAVDTSENGSHDLIRVYLKTL